LQVVELRLEAFGGGAMERPALFLMLSDGSLLTYRSAVHGGRLRFVRFDVGWLATGLLRPPGAPQLAPGLSRMTRVDHLRKDSPVAGVVSDRCHPAHIVVEVGSRSLRLVRTAL
jgi:hypothetical protein